ncbi:MAG: disulfide bond formation protein DsbA [Chitinophagaceae bacterium]|nr:MAG: disulfide bond formation protein DsbA [Chitinophagaceae bacterium]
MSFKKDDVEIIEPKDIFVGKKDAPVVLMEFGEYENADCEKANDIVKQILEDYDGQVKFNFRHFPQTRIHQRSLKAAEAAIAAGQEGKFWEMHNILFYNRRNLGTTSLKLHSKDAGVNNKNFLDDLVNGVYGWQVQDDLNTGIDLGVKVVPTFFINGKIYDGKITLKDLSSAIDEALKTAKTKAPAKKKAAPKKTKNEE